MHLKQCNRKTIPKQRARLNASPRIASKQTVLVFHLQLASSSKLTILGYRFEFTIANFNFN
nr:MAG TPA: hypothetical protein [Caudoviricetes sp.]